MKYPHFLVLDGTQATLNANETHMTWQIPQYYFQDFDVHKQDLFMSLVQCQFIGLGDSGLSHLMGTAEIYIDKYPTNSINTNGDNLLSIVDVVYTGANGAVSCVVSEKNPMYYKFNPFNDITISVSYHQGGLLSFGNAGAGEIDKDFAKFVFKLDYIDKE